MTYEFLQHYWWFLISLLAALLVFLLFVQGANSLLFSLGKNEEERRLIMNSTGRKWEITFTTLVTFGGAFFAAFPLFYATSFGGAFWLWTIVLVSFVLQPISYEFQNKAGNLFGARTFQIFLVINGIIGPLMLGGAIGTLFEGADFYIDKDNITNELQPVICRWANDWHGIDALFNPWVLVFGIMVLFMSQMLGSLYIMNNVNDEEIRSRASDRLVEVTIGFIILLFIYLAHLMLKDGYAWHPDTHEVYLVPNKYWHNILEMWYLLAMLLIAEALILVGVIRTLLGKTYLGGIWPVSIGVVLAVVALILCAGWNHTVYYPSNVDLQASLTIANSCASEFSLRAMAYLSFVIPFVITYIVIAWRKIDSKKLEKEDIWRDDAY